MGSSSTKTNSGVAGIAVVFVVTKDSDSCFWTVRITFNVTIKPLSLVTVELQGGLFTDQTLPCVASQ